MSSRLFQLATSFQMTCIYYVYKREREKRDSESERERGLLFFSLVKSIFILFYIVICT